MGADMRAPGSSPWVGKTYKVHLVKLSRPTFTQCGANGLKTSCTRGGQSGLRQQSNTTGRREAVIMCMLLLVLWAPCRINGSSVAATPRESKLGKIQWPPFATGRSCPCPQAHRGPDTPTGGPTPPMCRSVRTQEQMGDNAHSELHEIKTPDRLVRPSGVTEK